MPIYEYRCDACGHEFETIQKMSELPLSDCPECNAPQLKKLVSAAGFQLKGSGWYATDFKGKTGSDKKSSGDTGTEPKAGGCGGGACGCH